MSTKLLIVFNMNLHVCFIWVGGNFMQKSVIHLDFNNLIRLLLQYLLTIAKYTNRMTQFS